MSEVYPPINGLGQPFPDGADVNVGKPTPLDKHREKKFPESLRAHIAGRKSDVCTGEWKDL